MTLELQYQSYRLFPYERELARRELDALGLRVVRDGDASIVVEGAATADGLRRLTYFKSVSQAGELMEPTLATIERMHLARRSPPTARPRQVTRYLVHGLHEYKGKFHPQLVRAFANLLEVRPGDAVIDPFVGSGTTLVEASLLGASSVGVDLSPMAISITQAKLAMLRDPDPEALSRRLDQWADGVIPRVRLAYARATSTRMPQLDEGSVAYLGGWFTPPAHAALMEALAGLDDLQGDAPLHAVVSVAISSTLRDTSEQAPEDLRVRRRSPGDPAPPLPEKLAVSLSRATEAAREVSHLMPMTAPADVFLGDVTRPGWLSELRGTTTRASIITSPPYATALPYVDTDRLSLVALGFTKPSELRGLEADLIGSREWASPEQRRWQVALDGNASRLPEDVVALCTEIQGVSGQGGFRKRAVPGLLYRYFSMMSDVLRESRAALRPGERAVLIVGVNRTRSAAGEIVIDTPRLLGAVAEGRGFTLDELLPLETWPRYGLHQSNGVTGESAVLLRAV